ncbi:MAG: sulfatase/phosphatase domain-containing protein, partial [Akkermansiaceae bacterium]
KKRGNTNDDFTLSVDLAPTILSAAGLEAPKGMQGEDMAPLYLADDKPRWRTEFFYEHPCIRDKTFIPESEALVRKDWKYIYWPQHGVEQLFDLKADPREENDLVQVAAHSAVLDEMRQRFRELKAQAK